MKAAVLAGQHAIKIVEVPIPKIGPDEVLVRVKSAFICGTDVRFYLNGYPGVDENNPRILGHEFAGVIEEVGELVHGYRKGTPVAVAPNYGCGVCDLCVSGHSEMCKESEALGVTVDGGFAEFVRIPARAVQQGNLAPIPEGVSFGEAALAEPLSCVYNAYEKIGIYPGDTVLVIGSGPIGIMHCLVALAAGATTVFISDISEERMNLAVQIDPRIRNCLPEKTAGRAWKTDQRKAGGSGDHRGIGRSDPGAGVLLVGQNGRVMFFGGLPKGRSTVSLDTNEIHYKQLLVSGTTRQSLRQYRKCLELIGSKALMYVPS